ncbi:MAG: hypothetical protein HY958_08120 [Bacteroidia bacterium]|nr:hypothetical protein [Bacteroidia bacterium]
MNRLFRKILEYTWLVVAILSLAAGIHKTWRSGFAQSYPFFIMAFVSILMFMFRRFVRVSQKFKENK